MMTLLLRQALPVIVDRADVVSKRRLFHPRIVLGARSWSA
jgi:hypothetical protein